MCRCIGCQDNGKGGVIMGEYWGLNKVPFGSLKRTLRVLSPQPRLALLEKVVKWVKCGRYVW
jgi:hypothetical protein